MLVHLSNTSPYVCDLSRGPIEQSNRMASAPTKKAAALLEHKESFSKVARTPLKLLAPDEVALDTTSTATDIRASLQPIWYSEQTIVDDHPVQQEDVASIIQEQQQQRGRSLRPRTTLPTILSESPLITNEEAPTNRPSLMHKSSTFTIEPTTTIDSPLNDSEKENTTDHVTPPADDSFRALEQLLGLGSANTVRDSPKNNHDTLSLTVVTPTDIINSTTTSLRMSYAPKSGSDSLPSSQDLPAMPTIESINSTDPPSFLMENTTMEDQGISTTLNQQNSFDNNTMKDDIINDDDTNFSFELNDFSNNSKDDSTVNVPPPAVQPVMQIRAPTCADVAYRALAKARTGGRVSQPVKADSPLANTNKHRSSAPIARTLRSSSSRISTKASEQQPMPTTECAVNEPNTESPTELVEMVSLREEDENEQEKTTSVTLNLSSPMVTEQFSTPTRPMMPMLSREYTYNTPQSRASERRRSNLNASNITTNQEEPNSSMLGILLTKPTEAVQNVRKSTRNSPSIASKSMLGVLLTQPTEQQPTVAIPSPVQTSTRNSRSIASKSMLGVLLTQPTEPQPTVAAPSPVQTSTRNSRSIASKSMLGVLLTQPTEPQPTIDTPSPVRTSTRNSRSIASKSMLGVLLTQPTEPQPNVATPSPIQTPTRNSHSIASKSMLGVLLTQPTEEVEPSVATPSSVRKSARNSPSIVSKSMLGVLLTQPTEEVEPIVAAPSPIRTPTRKSSSIVSKSMLGVLLTQPTEQTAAPSPIHTATPYSPSVVSKSMLGVLLTNPTEGEANIQTPSPIQTSVRKSARSSSHPTPRVSINPLHSSTPSTSRHKSLQIVSIGEQEQVSTIVPQPINNEVQEIEIAQLNETEENLHTIDMDIQTTPSIDNSTRRRVKTPSQQATPVVEMNKSTSIVIVNEQKQITPLQSKLIMNLQRNVRFQLTPSTDARLAAKEKLEEHLRGLKPDVVIPPPMVMPQPKSAVVKAAATKKVAKPKKKVVAPKKKKVQQTIEKKSRRAPKAKPLKRLKSNSTPKKASKKKPEPTKRAPRKQSTVKIAVSPKPIQSKQPVPKITAPTKPVQRKQKTTKVTSPIKRLQRKQTIPKVTVPTKRVQHKQTTSKVATPTKRVQRKQATPKVTAPTKRVQRKQTIPKVTAPTERVEVKQPVPEPIKRAPRKRTIPEVTTPVETKQPAPEPIKRAPRKRTIPEKTIEQPIVKRAKISKSVKAAPKVQNNSNTNKKVVPEPIKREIGTRSRSTDNKQTIVEPKEITPVIKTSKRRLQSVDKPVEMKKKVEDKKVQPTPPVQKPELSQEERQKIEALTVAGLKSRLNTHKANVSKGAKKADLIALLIQIETNLLQERKPIETTPVLTTTMTTRRRKN